MDYEAAIHKVYDTNLIAGAFWEIEFGHRETLSSYAKSGLEYTHHNIDWPDSYQSDTQSVNLTQFNDLGGKLRLN